MGIVAPRIRPGWCQAVSCARTRKHAPRISRSRADQAQNTLGVLYSVGRPTKRGRPVFSRSAPQLRGSRTRLYVTGETKGEDRLGPSCESAPKWDPSVEGDQAGFRERDAGCGDGGEDPAGVFCSREGDPSRTERFAEGGSEDPASEATEFRYRRRGEQPIRGFARIDSSVGRRGSEGAVLEQFGARHHRDEGQAAGGDTAGLLGHHLVVLAAVGIAMRNSPACIERASLISIGLALAAEPSSAQEWGILRLFCRFLVLSPVQSPIFDSVRPRRTLNGAHHRHLCARRP